MKPLLWLSPHLAIVPPYQRYTLSFLYHVAKKYEIHVVRILSIPSNTNTLVVNEEPKGIFETLVRVAHKRRRGGGGEESREARSPSSCHKMATARPKVPPSTTIKKEKVVASLTVVPVRKRQTTKEYLSFLLFGESMKANKTIVLYERSTLPTLW